MKPYQHRGCTRGCVWRGPCTSISPKHLNLKPLARHGVPVHPSCPLGAHIDSRPIPATVCWILALVLQTAPSKQILIYSVFAPMPSTMQCGWCEEVPVQPLRCRCDELYCAECRIDIRKRRKGKCPSCGETLDAQSLSPELSKDCQRDVRN